MWPGTYICHNEGLRGCGLVPTYAINEGLRVCGLVPTYAIMKAWGSSKGVWPGTTYVPEGVWPGRVYDKVENVP